MAQTADALACLSLSGRHSTLGVRGVDEGLVLFSDWDKSRMADVYNEMSHLDARRLMLAIPRVEWLWESRALNAVVRAVFDWIDTDPVTFQPVGFMWAVPQLRAA